MPRSAPAAHVGGDPGEAEHPAPFRRMIEAVGLDPTAVAHDHPEVMRSVVVACRLCGAVERCGRSLDQGTAGDECDAFCPHAPIFRALVEHKRRLERARRPELSKP